MSNSYLVKDSSIDKKLAISPATSDRWAPVTGKEAIEVAASSISALLEQLGFFYGAEVEASEERKQANNLWSLPMNAKIKSIKGDYSQLPNWTSKLVDAFAERNDTSTMVAYKEDDYYVFRVFINNFSAESVGQYCNLYVKLTDNCDDCCCDFRVTANRDIEADEFPDNAVIMRI